MVREKRERKETDKAKTMREQLERLAQLREAARTNREQQQPGAVRQVYYQCDGNPGER